MGVSDAQFFQQKTSEITEYGSASKQMNRKLSVMSFIYAGLHILLALLYFTTTGQEKIQAIKA